MAMMEEPTVLRSFPRPAAWFGVFSRRRSFGQHLFEARDAPAQ